MIKDIIIHHPFLKNIVLSYLSMDDICNAMTQSITDRFYEVFMFFLVAVKSKIISETIRKRFDAKIVIASVSSSDTKLVDFVLQRGYKLHHMPELNFGFYSIYTPAIEKNDVAMIEFLDSKKFEFSAQDILIVLRRNIFRLVEFICHKKFIDDVSVLHIMISKQRLWAQGCKKVFKMYINMFLENDYQVDRKTLSLLLKENNIDILKENYMRFDNIDITNTHVPYQILIRIIQSKEYEFFKWIVTQTGCAVVKHTINNMLILQECFRIPDICPEFVRWVLAQNMRNSPNVSFESQPYIPDLIKTCIRVNNLVILNVLCQFMEKHQIPLTTDIIYESIKDDNLEIMKWCMEKKYHNSIDLKKCWLHCVRNKKLNIMKWLYRKNLYEDDNLIFDLSIKYYDEKIFDFFKKKRFTVSSTGLNFAVLTRNIRALMRLFDMSCPYNYGTIKIASDNEDYEMVDLLYNKGLWTDPSVYRKPVQTNNIEIVAKYLSRYCFPVDGHIFKLAVRSGNREIAQILLDAQCPVYDEDLYLFMYEPMFTEMEKRDVIDLLELTDESEQDIFQSISDVSTFSDIIDD